MDLGRTATIATKSGTSSPGFSQQLHDLPRLIHQGRRA